MRHHRRGRGCEHGRRVQRAVESKGRKGVKEEGAYIFVVSTEQPDESTFEVRERGEGLLVRGEKGVETGREVVVG